MPPLPPMRLTAFCFVAAVASIALSGCGGAGGGTAVTGKVTYQQEPLTNAALYFFPETGQPIVTALDANGQYSVDLPPGTYRVIVNRIDRAPPGWKEGDPPPPVATPLPPQYSEPAATVLSATVAENQSEPINFDLK